MVGDAVHDGAQQVGVEKHEALLAQTDKLLDPVDGREAVEPVC